MLGEWVAIAPPSLFSTEKIRCRAVKTESEILVVVNPIAGSLSDMDEFQSVLDERFNQQGKSFQVYETTGEENLPEKPIPTIS
jgi:hypothetical protein